jgi:drug/metabolite transporter (DMT)-like permease
MNDIAPFTYRPARWKVGVAFAMLYLCWGTTFLAIRKGVEVFPPALFGGSRVALAGLILLGYLALRGDSLRLSGRDFFWTATVGLLLFVGGNGLLNAGEQSFASGLASILAATSPLWMAVLELLWPGGGRLRMLGWLGVFAGLVGVVVVFWPAAHGDSDSWRTTGALLILGSAFSWAIGSLVLRYRRVGAPHLTAAAYQMVLGGSALVVLGLLLGEHEALDWQRVTPVSVYAFFHLLVAGSLIGFVAYNWLLRHVSVALVATHGYVNPMIAVLVGWLIAGEGLTGGILGGMAIILVGVALVRGGQVP